jgi:hypothetical protein
MHRGAPSEKDCDGDELKKRVWDKRGFDILSNLNCQIQDFRRTCDPLLPTLLLGQVDLETEAA